ncbi:GEVED domain-containing protein, partial [Chitinophagales bacterium]|nr:GEVED domain-containing protein [Chitinophagales bacterium]
YGAETIDLGAFGEDAYTIEFGGGYGGFGGTSGATPHVAGLIGLMYSIPCSGFIQQAKADPAAAALTVRQYIEEGVDFNQSLQGITTTGGRMNMFNSLELMMLNCSESDCPPPYSLAAVNATDTEAEISWNIFFPENVESFSVTITNEAGIVSQQLVTDNVLSLEGLIACSEYQIEVMAICAEENSPISQSFTFETDGCCIAPTGISVESEDASATVSWDSILAAASYLIRYREIGGAWIELSGIGTTTELLQNLAECTLYELQMASDCADGSGYSESINFSSACGVCIDTEYCDLNPTNNNFEYIDQFIFGDINVTSGQDNGAYALFSENAVALPRNCSVTMSLTPVVSSNQYMEIARIWLDMNQDGVFDEPAERLYQSSLFNTTITDEVLIPANAELGSTRLRVAMRFDNDPAPCGQFQYGEVEDYCVQVVEGDAEELDIEVPFSEILICPMTTVPLSVTEIEGASYSWLPTEGLDNPTSSTPNASLNSSITYTATVTVEGELCPSSGSSSVSVTVMDTPELLIDEGMIIACTEASAILNVINDSGATLNYNWSTGNGSFDGATDMSSVVITSTGTYTVSSIADGCNVSAEINITEIPTPSIPVISNDIDLLSVNEEAVSYQWHLNDEPILGANSSTFTISQSGNYSVVLVDENNCTKTTDPFNAVFSGLEETTTGAIQLFPNPSTGLFNLELLTSGGKIIVFNQLGQVVISDSFTGKELQLDLSDQPVGRYEVLVVSEGKVYRQSALLLN